MGFAFIPVLLMMAFFFGVPILVGVLVYQDAKRRGMDTILWALVAALVPGLIGLIVYLVVCRSRPSERCAACGATAKPEYVSCPQCGAQLRYRCEGCGAGVEAPWKVCAHCGKTLPENRPSATVRVEQSSKPLWILLICIVAVPVLLILLGIFGYVTNVIVG